MPGWLRKVRAAVTLGGLWGLSATAVSAVAYLFGQLVTTGGLDWGAALASAARYGVVGLVVGTAFAGTLVAFEGRNILGRLKPWRIALWGAVMGGSFPMIIEVLEGSALTSLGTMTGMTAFAAVVGATMSTGTILIAKAAKAELSEGEGAFRIEANREAHASAESGK